MAKSLLERHAVVLLHHAQDAARWRRLMEIEARSWSPFASGGLLRRRRRPLTSPLYARLMEQTRDIELVKVADGGRGLDGIVFDAPSRSKVTVAVMDPSRGPVFRTVHPDSLTDRTEAGPDDR